MIRIVPKWTKKIREDPIRLESLRRPGALASAYAEHVLVMVQRGGKSADSTTGAVKRKPYASKGRKNSVFVPEAYARAAGVSESLFDSSAEFHAAAGAKVGTYDVSGGMWRGLKVSGSKSAAVVGFGGSSVGAGATSVIKYKYKKHADGSFEIVGATEPKARIVKVQNRVKARKILQHHGVNVLAFRRGEFDALGSAVARHLGILVGVSLGMSIDFKASRFDRHILSRRAYARLSRG